MPTQGGGARLRRLSTLAVVLLATSLALGVVAPVVRAGRDHQELVVNGTFEQGLRGWRTNDAQTTLTTSTTARHGHAAAVLSGPPGANVVLNDSRNTVRATTQGTPYSVSAWVRTDVPGLSGQVRVREVTAAGAVESDGSFWLRTRSWKHVTFSFTATARDSTLDLNVLAWNLRPGQRLYVDDVSLRQTPPPPSTSKPLPSPAPTRRPSPRPSPSQPAEVSLSARGVPRSGALFGAAVGSNTDPARFESRVGKRLGVHRTYWGASQVDLAVAVAREDLARGRLPWISFKMPYSWAKMADGAGDWWARDLTARLAELPGPVWVAFHHEPEGDGRLQNWTAMQERLGPLVRSGARNVGFTVILTGWHQLYGPGRHSLDSVWPHTKVDVAGFDVYNSYGTTVDGHRVTKATDMRDAYFEPLSRWAKKKGVAWAIAETGVSDVAAKRYPQLLQQTYADLVATGGVAFTYFNTTLNSKGSWVITSQEKLDQYARTLKRSPRFPKIV
jgi:hypothetical protein